MNRLLKRTLYQWRIKLWMLGLATLLWIFVIHNQSYELTMDVPLIPVNLKPGKVIVSEIPEKIGVQFYGPGKYLQLIKFFYTPRVELDLKTINYFYDYPLELRYVIMPQGIKLSPLAFSMLDTIKIRLEDLEEKILPVVSQIDLQPRAGHMQVGQIRFIPDSIKVSGPQNLIRRMQSIKTVEKSYTDVRKSFTEIIDLEAAKASSINYETSSIKIVAKVDQIAEFTIRRIPLKAMKEPRQRRAIFEPTQVDAWLRGPSKTLARLTPDSLEAQVHLSNWHPNRRDYPIIFVLPEDVELLKSEPERVRVRLEVKETE